LKAFRHQLKKLLNQKRTFFELPDTWRGFELQSHLNHQQQEFRVDNFLSNQIEIKKRRSDRDGKRYNILIMTVEFGRRSFNRIIF
jgi:hypothetical protein